MTKGLRAHRAETFRLCFARRQLIRHATRCPAAAIVPPIDAIANVPQCQVKQEGLLVRRRLVHHGGTGTSAGPAPGDGPGGGGLHGHAGMQLSPGCDKATTSLLFAPPIEGPGLAGDGNPAGRGWVLQVERHKAASFASPHLSSSPRPCSRPPTLQLPLSTVCLTTAACCFSALATLQPLFCTPARLPCPSCLPPPSTPHVRPPFQGCLVTTTLYT